MKNQTMIQKSKEILLYTIAKNILPAMIPSTRINNNPEITAFRILDFLRHEGHKVSFSFSFF